MPMGPKDLIFTEEAVLLMDLVKVLTWKSMYETAAQAVRDDGRGMITIEDILANLDAAIAQAAVQARKSADTLIEDRGI